MTELEFSIRIRCKSIFHVNYIYLKIYSICLYLIHAYTYCTYITCIILALYQEADYIYYYIVAVDSLRL